MKMTPWFIMQMASSQNTYERQPVKRDTRINCWLDSMIKGNRANKELLIIQLVIKNKLRGK